MSSHHGKFVFQGGCNLSDFLKSAAMLAKLQDLGVFPVFISIIEFGNPKAETVRKDEIN